MATTGPTGDGQISSEFGFQPPVPLSLSDFFLFGGYFGHELADFVAASNLQPKKTFAASDTYKAALSGRPSAATSSRVFIFSELPALPEKVSRNSERGGRGSAFECEADDDYGERGRPLVNPLQTFARTVTGV
jgi:hypothetical protein